ncbi:hypothetical protein JMJ77_0003337, partial [Colletotrichum scovillei]
LAATCSTSSSLSLSTAATINHRPSAIEDSACDLVSTQSLAYHNLSFPSPPLKVFRKGKVPCRRRLTPARPHRIRTANNDPNTPARYPCPIRTCLGLSPSASSSASSFRSQSLMSTRQGTFHLTLAQRSPCRIACPSKETRPRTPRGRACLHVEH